MLNPNLDASRLAGAFRARGRLQVRDIFNAQAAESVHTCLAGEVPWNFAYRLDGRDQSRPATEFSSLPPEQLMAIGARILEQARTGFSFGFMSFPMVEAWRRQSNPPGFVLDAVVEALASPEFIGFAQTLTGDPRIARVDAQATRYTPGHFLTMHDDAEYEGAERRAAYVLNFTRGWRAEWGGTLQFLDAEGGVEETFVPHFNSMSVFAVPARHLVSYVAPYANAPRLSITGWFTA